MSDSEQALQPFYLFADSQLLFNAPQGRPLLSALFDGHKASHTQAAYIGVSNGDQSVFYEMFVSAMQLLGISACRHVKEEFNGQDRDFLSRAQLILLAGGDTVTGMRKMQKNGMDKAVVDAYYSGAALVGISAGAIQLGLAFGERPMLQLIPLYLSAHEEERDWQSLEQQMRRSKTRMPGIGIPAGGGLCYYPDHSIRALNKPLIEITRQGEEELRRNVLLPEN